MEDPLVMEGHHLSLQQPQQQLLQRRRQQQPQQPHRLHLLYEVRIHFVF